MALDRERIMRTALRLLDDAGLETLSLRRLARELDVQVSALYWHFHNKQELLDEMARAIVLDAVNDDTLPAPAADTWQELLVHLGRTQRHAVRRHRDGATLMLRARPLADYQLDYLDWVLARLADAGFTRAEAAGAFVVISNYALGSAAVEHRTTGGASDDAVAAALTAHPSLRMIARQADDADALFERGLRWMVDGMAASRR